MKKLTKNEMKNVMGGVVADGDCGIKIDGEWIRIWGMEMDHLRSLTQ